MNKKSGSVAVKLAFVIVIGFLILAIVNIQFNLRNLKTQKLQLEKDLIEAQDKVDEINALLSADHASVEFIEKIAKQKLGLRNHNDIIFHNFIAN